MNLDQGHLFYRANTLVGSSGAPIFCRGSLCGIHIGADTLSPDAKIELNGLRYGVTNRNKGVYVDEQILQLIQEMPAIRLI